MKKFLTMLMLSVLIISFVGTALVSTGEAKPTCPKDPPCLAEVYPDGSVYVCCYTYVYQHQTCVLKLVECYWVYPA